MSQTVKSKSEWYEDLIRRSGMPLQLGMFPLRVYHYLQRKCFEFSNWQRSVFYVYFCIPVKVFQVRRKKKIKVLFVLTELGLWKTELLYRRMLSHERFDPVIGLSASAEYPRDIAESSKRRLAKYCADRGYDFYELDDDSEDSKSAFMCDIIFYQQPYQSVYQSKILFSRHFNALFCYALYAFHSVVLDWQINLPIFRVLWQNYFENDLTKNPLNTIRKFRHDNLVVTGLPMSDALLMPKGQYANPWKPLDDRKRIIYAPHCTIADHLEGVNYSTFLQYAEDMRRLSIKYKELTQWAFKPHPALYARLVKLWGQEKTDEYYNWWRQQENTQLEDGQYTGLFMHSDAMIHDCGSFTIEYHYSGNPVLYLLKDDGHEDSLNEFSMKAFSLHYKGRCLSDIDTFIGNVIAGRDPLEGERKKFYADYLVPPHGKSACDNIIDSILGQNGYQ